MNARHASGLFIDIGGTNIRISRGVIDGLGEIEHFKTQEFSDLKGVLSKYKSKYAEEQVETVYAAVAAPVVGDRAKLTNADFFVCADDVTAIYTGADTTVINDGEALAWQFANEEALDIRYIQRGAKSDYVNNLIVAPGTGLAAAAFFGDPVKPRVIGTEYGHVRPAPSSALQSDLFNFFFERDEYLSAETLVSGPGLFNIYKALSAKNGATGAAIDPKEIVAAAIEKTDENATQATDIFLTLLGSICGDLALTFSADRVCIAGNLILAMMPLLENSAIVNEFTNKGRMSHLVSATGFGILEVEEPVLAGLYAFSRNDVS